MDRRARPSVGQASIGFLMSERLAQISRNLMASASNRLAI
ncbi:hypothetical protein BS78_03G316500 [Paspalum vaginatum]|nr:hypothetical protein BS78_03G316500 [Paspalum vaginatum]